MSRLSNRLGKEMQHIDKYYATYKCSLCGKLLTYGDPKEVPYDVLPSLCGRIIKNQMFMNNPALYQAPMQVPCKCMMVVVEWPTLLDLRSYEIEVS